MAILEVEHINKKFDRTEVLKDISFSLEQGRFFRSSDHRVVERQHCFVA